MFVKSIKTTLTAFALLSSFSVLAHAGKTEILNFSSSEKDPETGKVIMKMIRKANPSYFRRDAEHRKNREGKPAYSLYSHGQGESQGNKGVSYHSTTVNLKKGSTETSLNYEANGYTMILELKMSGKLLTEEGKVFFCNRAKENHSLIK